MACSDFNDNFEFLKNLNSTHGADAIICSYTDVVGMAAFAVFVFGTLALMYRLHGRSWIVPLVLAIMFGSIVIVELPGIAVRMAVLGSMILVPAGVLYLFHRARPVR